MKENPKGAIPLRERVNLGDQWDDYAREILPQGAGVAQKVETRRAFYAGAAAMFSLLSNGFDADSEPTDLDLDYVTALSREIAQFGEDIARGKA